MWIGGYVHIINNPSLTTLGAAFPALTSVGGQVGTPPPPPPHRPQSTRTPRPRAHAHAHSRTSSLARSIAPSPSPSPYTHTHCHIHAAPTRMQILFSDNSNLAGFGAAFTNLTYVGGALSISGSPSLGSSTGLQAFASLASVGGVTLPTGFSAATGIYVGDILTGSIASIGTMLNGKPVRTPQHTSAMQHSTTRRASRALTLSYAFQLSFFPVFSLFHIRTFAQTTRFDAHSHLCNSTTLVFLPGHHGLARYHRWHYHSAVT
jgi:hypothetical protein